MTWTLLVANCYTNRTHRFHGFLHKQNWKLTYIWVNECALYVIPWESKVMWTWREHPKIFQWTLQGTGFIRYFIFQSIGYYFVERVWKLCLKNFCSKMMPFAFFSILTITKLTTACPRGVDYFSKYTHYKKRTKLLRHTVLISQKLVLTIYISFLMIKNTYAIRWNNRKFRKYLTLVSELNLIFVPSTNF